MCATEKARKQNISLADKHAIYFWAILALELELAKCH